MRLGNGSGYPHEPNIRRRLPSHNITRNSEHRQKKHQPKWFCQAEVRKGRRGRLGCRRGGAAAPGSTTQNSASNGLQLKAQRKHLLKILFPWFLPEKRCELFFSCVCAWFQCLQTAGRCLQAQAGRRSSGVARHGSGAVRTGKSSVSCQLNFFLHFEKEKKIAAVNPAVFPHFLVKLPNQNHFHCLQPPWCGGCWLGCGAGHCGARSLPTRSW